MTAHTPLFPSYTEFKTVENLELGLEPGWDLLRVIPSQKLQVVFEDIGVDPSVAVDQGNGYSAAQGGVAINGARNYVVNNVLFLLGRNKDDTLAKLKGTLDAEKAVKGEQKKKIEELEKLVEQGLLGIRNGQAQHKHLEDDVKSTREEWNKLREQHTKMENDIGKLREHFGKKAVDEALGID